MAEMPDLEGEERVLQEKRVKAQSESPGPNPRACHKPSSGHQAEVSSSHCTSGRKGEGSQDRRSQRQSEPTSSRLRRDGGDESDLVYEVPCPGRTHITGSQDTLPITAQIGPRVPTQRQRCSQAPHHPDAVGSPGRGRPVGPACFGPRIRGEPFPRGFTLPRDTPKYNGTAKPEDWLIDSTTAIGIARGNKRVAVRYVPLMLAGSARTWLNSLPAGSVNSWVDFEEAFVHNFTGTYKCPAIQYFVDECRDGTLLKHKLMCSEPTSLVVLMSKADKYAMTDSTMRVKVTASDKTVPAPTTPKSASDNQGGQNNKRKANPANCWPA
ncbi:DNA mismatch repair protein Mlh1 [Hordeum vulgare]|nr:DNA mismatch repair protein Mlh1 [Hordeum vulgare]